MQRQDVIAGISVAGLVLPEAIAYAQIAGLKPQSAIVGAIAGCAIYPLVGRSRFAIIAPTSSAATILAAATLYGPEVGGGGTAPTIIMVVVIVASLFLAAAILRLGNLAGFISKPVLLGFAFGLSITIVARQLGSFTGTPAGSNEPTVALAAIFGQYVTWHYASIGIGLCSLLALLALRTIPAFPSALVVLAAGIAAGYLLPLSAWGVATVGHFAFEPAWPSLPSFHQADLRSATLVALPLALIIFAESWGTVRSISSRYHETASPTRELAALGFTNLASGLVGGMPVGAGFSVGLAAENSGSKTTTTAWVAALCLLLTAVLAPSLLSYLPVPVLASVVVASLTHSMNLLPIIRLFRLGRDGYAAVTAALGVILLGVVDGVALAVVLTILALLRRLSNPYVARLGQFSDGHDFVDIRHHPTASEIPDVAIWRPAEPLFFANAEPILGQIALSVAASGHGAVILSLEESIDFDSTAVDALLEFDSSLTNGGKLARYARVHDRVRNLIASERPDIRGRCCFSVDDAVTSVRKEASLRRPILAGQTRRNAASPSDDGTLDLTTADLSHANPSLASAHIVQKRKPS